MKTKNFFGDNMPVLPWMINFDCPKTKCFKQEPASNAKTELDYQANLSIKAKCIGHMLTTLMVTLGFDNACTDFIETLIKENIRSVCIDTSRGTEVEHIYLLDKINNAVKNMSEQCGRVFPFAVALELAGLRIRTGILDSDKLSDIYLEENNYVYITTNENYGCHCNKNMIYVNYKSILDILAPGNFIYIDYGVIILEVIEIGKTQMFYNQVKCKVINGGKLRDEAIIHLPNVPHNYEREMKTEMVRFGLKNDIDALLLCRVHDSHIIKVVRTLLGEEGNKIMIISKIEDTLAVENIDEIIEHSDGIIISRCELGLELPPEKLFIVQKSVIAKCNKVGKPVMCSGHFLKSMYKNHLPTRPEMMDAANAVLDGADGIILSHELSVSPNFIEIIHSIQNICLESENAVHQKRVITDLIETLPELNEPSCSIAVSAVDCSMRSKAACIIVLTVSGRSAKLIAQYRPRCPILAVTRYQHVARKLNLWRGVIPLLFTGKQRSDYLKEIDTRFHFAITFGKYSGLIRGSDKLILVSGWRESSGFTNTLRIVYASQNDCVYLKPKPCNKNNKNT